MNIQLFSKNALVGAATQGIGAGIAIELAKCGANVTVMSRNEDKLKDFVSLLPIVNADQKHEYLVADFSDFESYKKTITDYFSNHSIDILVNNTNGPEPGLALDKNAEDYQKAFDLLFKTVCETTLLALPHMIQQKKGRIINVSSLSVKEPINNLALSNSIRSAVIAWAKTLSNEIAQHNVTVNNVLTGYFDTERIQNLINHEAQQTGASTEEIKKARENKIPMKRLGKPEEYGHLVAFLASEYSAYLTGTSIPLDGGLNNTY
ncbi:SDR family oxidoreductase [Chryseobacterium rhizosphaerae]|uniref:SDR family NAD(P)-dependent oxidoreductase n=1 Tax=Chryseobacterium rhizosphaerae TaxID=395937 RepID=A0ABX9IJ37_9FLAO|nr:SDR family oxidoreductase [Chryseobacterium rhizosphaerae]REC74710.1 SDR family NAD(P)-dependent oxidoreductase [Chryseobacterium rhizosphaerae]GEN66243.1 short-chain dehydrogenase [Chryseobacterium rhizosphaerae]